jgi:hypothetical protein
MNDNMLPFYFAVPHVARNRAAIPAHVFGTYNVSGQIEFVRSDEQFRLYRVVAR